MKTSGRTTKLIQLARETHQQCGWYSWKAGVRAVVQHESRQARPPCHCVQDPERFWLSDQPEGGIVARRCSMRDGFMQDPERFWLSDHPEGGIVRPVVQHEWRRRPLSLRARPGKILAERSTRRRNCLPGGAACVTVSCKTRKDSNRVQT